VRSTWTCSKKVENVGFAVFGRRMYADLVAYRSQGAIVFVTVIVAMTAHFWWVPAVSLVGRSRPTSSTRRAAFTGCQPTRTQIPDPDNAHPDLAPL
jgi:hypothetical protein